MRRAVARIAATIGTATTIDRQPANSVHSTIHRRWALRTSVSS